MIIKIIHFRKNKTKKKVDLEAEDLMMLVKFMKDLQKDMVMGK